MIINYHIIYFLKSVPNIRHLPKEKTGAEVAFVGYSNSGKSSIINALTFQKKLTKVSKTPGCTQLINLFEIKPGVRIIDFPGYGYAKRSKKNKNYWNDVVCKYLEKRKNLKGLVLIMDIRHPMKNLDKKIIKNSLSSNIPIFILLNKSDKISKNISQNISKKITQDIQIMYTTTYIQVESSSAVKKHGIELLKKILNHWLTLPK